MKKIILVVAVVMIAVMLTVLFVGCSAEDYKKQLENKGYTATAITNETAMAGAVLGLKVSGIDVKGKMEYVVTGTKDGSSVTIIKFEKSSDASSVRKSAKDNAKGDVKVGGSGKVVKITITTKK